MRDILSRRERSTFAALPARRLLVAFDYDGTLAPLAETPNDARMRPATRRLLRALARHVPCAVISGRRRAEVARYLRGVRCAGIVGNHGLEDRAGLRPSPRLASWRRRLTDRLAGQPGVWVEDKRFTLAVHYRQAPRAARARRAILRVASALSDARVIDGALVIDVVPRTAPDKGRALGRLLARAGRTTAIYVGDDETDEHAFAHVEALGGLAIRVGAPRASRATHFLRSQWQIEELLRLLIRAVRPGRAASRRRRFTTAR